MKSLVLAVFSFTVTLALGVNALALVCTGQHPGAPSSVFKVYVANGIDGDLVTLTETTVSKDGETLGSYLRFYPVKNQYGRVFEVGYGPLEFELLRRDSLSGPADLLGSLVSPVIDRNGSIKAISVEVVYEYTDKITQVRVLGPKGIYAPAIFEVAVTCK